MPATPGEQALLAQLTRLAAGQASGSFGPGQALALLAGYVKLRDRVDEHGANLQTAMDNVAALQTSLDAATKRITELETAEQTRDASVADIDARTATLEADRDALTLRVAALEQPPPAA